MKPIQSVLFAVDPEGIIPSGAPTPAPMPEPEHRRDTRARRITCEFCGCSLDSEGGIVRMGEDAKRFRDADEELEAATKSVHMLEAEMARLKTELESLKPKPGNRAVAAIAWK